MEAIGTEDLKLGMELISRLPEIMPDQADDRIRPIYEDIKNTFRVPIVNFFFRVLANYPFYLVSAWNEFGPCLRTVKLEKAADNLRSAALLEPVPDSSGLEWPPVADLFRIRAFTDTIHYLLPKLLLVATAFHEGFLRNVRASGRDVPGSGEQIPPGVAQGTVSIPMVNPEETKGTLRAVFDEIKERHGHPEVATYYRSLGHWSRFLLGLWERVKPRVASPSYEQRKRALLGQALWALEDCCPSWKDFTIKESLSSRELEEIRALCAVFRYRLIPDLLLDVSLIKAMLDGPEAARISRFSFTPRGGHS
ncbi:MAG TPA: halocarboxylic acid dehydrogenase DehI family protein [Candidatus Binatia bacterium]|nr:halocarboxylic acid dehydrogenase DehI family protein [Candidatus Binatia bacterium]